MRILMHDFGGYAFAVALSRELASRGQETFHLHCSSLNTPKGAVESQPEDPASFTIKGLALSQNFEKYSLFKRLLHELRYGQLLIKEARALNPDLVVSANTPLFSQATLMTWTKRHKVPFVFWLQDLQSEGMKAKGASKFGPAGRIVAVGIEALERAMLKRSDAVITITEDFEPILTNWGIRPDRIRTIHNWAPIEETPQLSKSNEWSRHYGFDSQLVFLYSGTLGLKHNPELLWELASSFTGAAHDAAVVVISEGSGMDWLKSKQKVSPNPRLHLLPYQDYGHYPEILASGDVLIGILEPSAGLFSVPSKIMSYHCAGRAILGAIPGENLAARTIFENDSGQTVEPDDVEGFITSANKLVEDNELRALLGTNAREYAERRFDITSICNRFLEVFGSVAPRNDSA